MLQTMSRPATLAARTLLLAGLGLAAGGGAQAQIAPRPTPIVKPAPTLTRELATLPAPDLVIDKVQIAQVPNVPLRAVAYVTVRNAGSANAVFPAGGVVVSGAAASGGLRFPNLVAQAEFVLAPGQSQVLVLHSQDPCTAGWGPAPVTFQVNPQGAVQEPQRGNNSSTLAPPVADLATSDLVASGLRIVYGTDPRDNRSPAQLLAVTVKNNGSGPALLCPGMTLVRQTASPLAAKYGLQSVAFNQPAPAPPDPPTSVNNPGAVRQADYVPPTSNIVILPGATTEFRMLAYKPGDLQPGVYEWKAKVNPDGTAREASTGNNEGVLQYPVQ